MRVLQQYDPESAWWNFCAVGNYASRFYVYTLPAIQALQQQLFDEIYAGAQRLESRVTLMSSAAAVMDASGTSAVVAGQQQQEGWVKEAVSLITEFTTQSGTHISTAWRDFLPTLFSTYRDGQIVTTNLTYIIRRSMFYPMWWLNLVGYWDIPGNANGIYFEGRPSHFPGDGSSNSSQGEHGEGPSAFSKYLPKQWSNFSNYIPKQWGDYARSESSSAGSGSHQGSTYQSAGPAQASWAPVMMAAVAVTVFGFVAGRHSATQNRRRDYIPIAGSDQL